MKKQTIAIDTPYVRPDTYGSLAVPIYNNVAFEFEKAEQMADAFCNHIKAPSYARVENPTVTNLEQRVRLLTDATHVTAYNSGMAAISNTLLAVASQGKNIVTSHHLFGNTLALVTNTHQLTGCGGCHRREYVLCVPRDCDEPSIRGSRPPCHSGHRPSERHPLDC